ncbi:UDP-2,4-diacetamido-2,4,6-trideoxy-beta-L-altropyranose hydrolase [Synechococcus sp. AH-601-N10]|nr:UDP-2,4-diacetamido-2,4,6-trideoxy-beta-L-altropyranose hydrolase [Synechococcus sp. AH-601-N10]
MRVLIRADASPGIGSGHWMRCRSLSRALKREGVEVRFCGRAPEGRFREALAEEFPLISLPLSEGQSINPAQGCWLPVRECEDASCTQKSVEADGEWRPDWIVVDHYGISAIWHQQIREAWPFVRIAVIDDLADRAQDADLLVDHNTFQGDPSERYRPWLPVDREVRLCLGPQFALIDPFHAGFHGALPPRERLQRLLISLGGAGDVTLLEQILQVLAALPLQGLQIQLVQGGFARESLRIQSLCEQLGVQRFSALPSLAPLMASADAAIGAGGTTTWERLCLGLPSITYVLAANQEAYSQVLADQGVIEYLGRAEDFDAGALKQVLQRWFQEPERLKSQSTQGMQLVDGQGCVRVARLMAAATNPSCWSELSSEVTRPEATWRWNDGLLLTGPSDQQPGPLTCLDRLEIDRRSFQSSSEFVSRLSAPVLRASEVHRVTVVSSFGSWMNLFIPSLLEQALGMGCSVRWVHDHRELASGDVCFLLSYGRIVSEEWLALNRHNLVVHASALPQGKGWSPMTWQILEGATSIPLTLFEAAADLDAGPIHAQEMLQMQGHELAPEWQQLQAMATVRLCTNWLRNYPLSAASPQPQVGAESCYSRRRPEDSRMDPALPLQEQFPLLQVVDNEAYPAFFELKGRRFRICVEPWQ